MSQTFNAEVHGITAYNKNAELILKVPDISRDYVITVKPEIGIDIDKSLFPDNFNINQCPRSQSWNGNCQGQCNTFSAVVELNRGQIRKYSDNHPSKAGQSYDPKYPSSYYWNFLSFVGQGPASNLPANSNDSNGATRTYNPNNLYGMPKQITDGELGNIRREMATNDRTALMQATSYFVAEPIEDILVGATKMADWLNQRTIERHSSENFLANNAPEQTEVSNTVTSETPIRNREDMFNAFKKHGISTNDASAILQQQGYEHSSDYLKQHPNDFQGLFNLIYNEMGQNKHDEEVGGIEW